MLSNAKQYNVLSVINVIILFYFSFENDSTKHRSAQSINQFKFEGQTKKKKNKPNKNLPNKNKI